MLRILEPEEVALIERMNVVLFSKEMSFEEAVREYRRIEAEFVERACDNEYHVVETRRLITERLLSEALRYGQPHEVCREIWHELLQRGFSDVQKRYNMSGIYARCCQMNGEFDEGLAVIEPLIAEAEQGLADPALPPYLRIFYEYTLPSDRKIRAELKAGIRSLMQQIEAVYHSEELTFEEAVREYRRIEEEFVERAGDNEADVVETRRSISEYLLHHALEEEQPHEVCREIWHELLQRGFSRIQDRHSLSRVYARCCQMNGEFDAGLAVIEPLIAECEQEPADPALPDAHAFYEYELEKHRKIRDELKAGVRG
jgi:hypothetical protein